MDADEIWPADLAPPKPMRRRRRLFRRALEKRQAYVEGDGIKDYVLLSWGNGGSGRLGTGATSTEFSPREVARSSHLTVLDVAAAPRHTVVVTRDGIAYAFGEGANGQLGSKPRRRDVSREEEEESLLQAKDGAEVAKRLELGKVLVAPPRRKKREPTGLSEWLASGGRQILRYPTPTFPLGIRASQVVATLSASLAREVSGEEAIARRGLGDLLERLRALETHLGGFAETVARLRAAIAQERFELRRTFRGRVVAWGDGVALGLGPEHRHRATPAPVPRLGLLKGRVSTLAAGRHHVLALGVDDYNETVLYSWGRGSGGRLGHDDYADRDEPTVVAFFSRRRVRLVAAGGAHSTAVVDDASPEVAGVYTWGRGAHGRLGLGRHLNKRRPHRVELWPSSFANSRVVEVALGGAHSLALAEEPAPPGLVNPWGLRRRVYAWGCGVHGALGTDRLDNCATPQLVKIPKWEVVASIAAGRNHSLAVTVRGDLYSWGKGWCGELGHGDTRLRIAPCRVEGLLLKAQVLRVSGGDAHTVAVALRHRAKSKRDVEKAEIDSLRSECLGDDIGRQQPSAAVTKLGWECVRSWPVPAEHRRRRERRRPRAFCATCGAANVCAWCARACHAGHDLRASLLLSSGDGEEEDNVCPQLCDCGLLPTCRRLPPPSESRDPSTTTTTVLGRLQRWARKCAAERELDHRRTAFRDSRRLAVVTTWHAAVLGAVWDSAREFRERRIERLERERMANADSESFASRRFLKLQVALQAIEAQIKVLRHLCSRSGAPDPHPASAGLDARFRSVRALRQWHRRHERSTRLSPAELRRWAERHGLSSVDDHRTDLGLVPDPDLCLLALRARAASLGDADPEAARRLRRRASVAAPERLYARVRWLRYAQTRRLCSRRRRSLHLEAREDESSVDERRREAEQLPPIHRFRHRRSAAESAEDRRDAEMTRNYRAGVAASLDQTRAARVAAALEAAEAAREDGSALARPICRALAQSSQLPGKLFVPAPTRRDPFAYTSRRSRSVAAPERLAEAKRLWDRYGRFMRDQQAAPTKYRPFQVIKKHNSTIEVRERALTFSNTDDGAGTRPSEYVEAARLDLSREDWEEQSRLVEMIAAKAGRREWLLDHRDEERDAASSDDARGLLAADAPSPSRMPSEQSVVDPNSPPPLLYEEEPRDYTPEESAEADFGAAAQPVYADARGNHWTALVDDAGNRYYYCEATGESSWYPWSTGSAARDAWFQSADGTRWWYNATEQQGWIQQSADGTWHAQQPQTTQQWYQNADGSWSDQAPTTTT
ncbi:hypothetical protein CTAYLR_008585 [Chrysophaeum taylorii]|uniref:Uncharacterized protein n=1 Tax=Chrysophaeum taylorii TaxID=2483200 RepID=A0AAD7UEU9_9STRA|nr:hypothetical protein CTAYLR_008585 [Chrysophaeum taylorii]